MPPAVPMMPHLLHNGLAIYRVGAGDPVLVMPGPHRFERPGLRAADALIDGLSALGRQVITFDPPGSGRSLRPARLGMAEMHECTDEALREGVVAEAVDAVGHSMAGLVLLAYGLDRPQRIRRLVLIGTGSGGPAYMHAPGALWNHTHPGLRGMAALGILHFAWPRRATETLVNNYIERRSFADPRLAEIQPLKPGDWLRPRRGNPEWHRIARKLDYTSQLPEVTAPTLILCGRHDPQYPPACSQQLANAIHGSHLVFFEHSGYFPYLEEYYAFWDTVATFLHPCDQAQINPHNARWNRHLAPGRRSSGSPMTPAGGCAPRPCRPSLSRTHSLQLSGSTTWLPASGHCPSRVRRDPSRSRRVLSPARRSHRWWPQHRHRHRAPLRPLSLSLAWSSRSAGTARTSPTASHHEYKNVTRTISD